MTKTKLTKEIEQALVTKTMSGNFKNIYGALEVPCGQWLGKGHQNIDFATYAPATQEIVCYEIKVTMSDFNSHASLSFYGNKNYLVMPYDLARKTINILQSHKRDQLTHIKDMRRTGAGIIAYMPGSYSDYQSNSEALSSYQKAINHLAVLKTSKKREVHFADKMALIEGILRAGCRDAAKAYCNGEAL